MARCRSVLNLLAAKLQPIDALVATDRGRFSDIASAPALREGPLSASAQMA
jgi:hypothetical protein